MRYSVADMLLRTLPGKSLGRRVTLPFFHSITTTWNWSSLDHTGSDSAPDPDLSVTGLVLSSNIENTFGKHEWDIIESSLKNLGFINVAHQYFEHEAKVNHSGMAFGISGQAVNGKYVVAAVFRGSITYSDYISDVESELFGFHQAGVNACRELAKYISMQGLSKSNTTLFLTGHSYGAAVASLVAIMSSELAERDSVFCYAYASPNYLRKELSGSGMKMFSFCNTEDIVPNVPIGFNLDKTGKIINLDNGNVQTHDPRKYERFLRLYLHFRDKDFDKDGEQQITIRGISNETLSIKESVLRNHMPCTYMALILAQYPDEVANSYIHLSSDLSEHIEDLKWEICVGERYKLPSCDRDNDHTKLTWNSSDKTVIEIDETGMLTAQSAGTAVLCASAEDGRKASVSIRVINE